VAASQRTGRPAGLPSRRWRLGFCASDVGSLAHRLREWEDSGLGDASPARRAEFAAGRWCARTALGQLEGPVSAPLPNGRHGSPDWPPGFVGSITHTPRFTAAAVARRGWRVGVRGIGLDAEEATPLPAGVLDVVASTGEREDLRRLARVHSEVLWDTVLFTVKEATYKAVYPLLGEVLAHHDVSASLFADGRFRAVARIPGSTRPGRSREVRGRWVQGPRVVVSLGVVE
jgi:4'-phosphopantetheinyl transferase EntD